MDKLKPVAWQFKDDDGAWKNGMSENNHRENTEQAGIKTRDLYALPEGYVIVPVEPTDKMCDAGTDMIQTHCDSQWIYTAMIEAAQEEG